MKPDADEQMWRDIASRIAEKRQRDHEKRDAHNDSIDWSWLPERCPDCRLSWTLYPPARIETGGGWHTGECRCVECKRVYPAAIRKGSD